MNRLFGFIAIFIFSLASEAGAGVINYTGSVVRDGSTASVNYYSLDLSGDDDVTFRITGDLSLGFSARLDPILQIFKDDGDLSMGDFLATIDFYVHGNPRTVELTAGSYILALSDYSFTIPNALAGINPDGSLQGVFAYTLSASSASIAEPFSLALFGAGLALFGLSVRRKRP